MSPDFLPLRPAASGTAGSPAPSASAATGKTSSSGGTAVSGKAAEAARLAKASKDFQAIFLMEMMKPMTEELSNDPSASSGGGSGDNYSWFWNEALASKLAGAWPLPSLAGIDPSTAAAAAKAGPAALQALSLGASPMMPLVMPAGVTEAAGGGIAATPATTGTGAARGSAVRPAGTRTDLGAVAGTTAGTAGTPASEASGTNASGAASPTGTHDSLLARAGRLFKLPVNLLRAVVMVESGGKENAVSSKGAVGLMQLMPDTAKEMGIQDPQDPWQNLYAGAKYLSRQVARFDSLEEAVAAYNAGPGAVEAHQGVPPFQETRNYVQRVLDAKARLDLLYPQDG